MAGDWVNYELYLMSFHLKGETAVYRYDVLLEVAAIHAIH